MIAAKEAVVLRVLISKLEMEVLADFLQDRRVDFLEVDLSLFLLYKATCKATSLSGLGSHQEKGRCCMASQPMQCHI